MKSQKIYAYSLIAFSAFIGLAACVSHARTQAKKFAKKPNIVFFLVDDMGLYDTSVPFDEARRKQNDFFQTPNMQRLAKEGVVFTNAHACAVCSPTRVSLMTGYNAARHGVTNWTLSYNKTTDANPKSCGIILPSWNMNGISPDQGVPNTCYAPHPLPAELKKCGYQTFHVGKAHFGANKVPEQYRTAEDPLRIGFDVNIGGWAGGGTQTYYPPYEKGWGGQFGLPGLEEYEKVPGKDGVHLTEALTREALKTLDKAHTADSPFFLYLSHYAVHVPFEMDVRYADKYKDDTSQPPNNRAYASLIEGMDKSLGDVLDYLDKKGLRDNTIIVFMSDNGGYALGQRENSNLPLSDGKGSSHQGGLRVPLIVSVPKGLRDARCDKPVMPEDVYATFLDAAGADFKPIKQSGADGETFLPHATKKNQKFDANRSLVFHFPNRWIERNSGNLKKPNSGYGPFSTIIQGKMKYIFFYEPERLVRHELFDLKADPGEKTNLYKNDDSRAQALQKDLQRYLDERKADFPTDSKTGELIKVVS